MLSVIPQQHVDPGAAPRRERLFPKTARVLRTVEFRNIYDNGVRFSTPLFAAFCLLRQESLRSAGPRLGLTVPRAVGKAVFRNRIKRRLREAFRLQRHRIGPWDIVLNPRRGVLDASTADIERAFEKVIQRCPV